MKLTRRDFLKWAGLSAMGAVACNFFPDREMRMQSPAQLPEDLVTGRDNWYSTLCGQCPEREGIVVRVMEGRAKKVQGNPIYPTNMGKQSARCEGGLQTLYHPDRLSGPMEHVGVRGVGIFKEIGWDDAMNRLRDRLKGLRDQGDSRAMLMVTDPLRGHLGMVVSRFVESYGGRPPLAFEPLEQTTLRAAVKRIFDQDVLPDFDIENSRYVLSFGADFLSTWLSPVRYARGYGEFRSQVNGKKRGTFTHVDPRYSMTAANADQWIPIAPGKEGILALSIAYVIIEKGLADAQAEESMGGRGPLLTALKAFEPRKVVDIIGMPDHLREETAAEVIERIAREFADVENGPSLAIGGGEAGAHTNGLFNLSAIYALNFLVGSVGRQVGQGGIVFNPPPAIDVNPAVSTASPLSDWRTVIDDLRNRDIKVVMVRGANPVHGLPDALGLREALEFGDPYVVSFSSFMDDTSQMADLVLPDRVYLEEWGDDVAEPGPGYQVVGIQQPVVNPLPDLDPRSFPDILLTLSQELGLADDLPNSFQNVLRDWAKQKFEDKEGLPLGEQEQGATFEAFWNKLLQTGGWWDGTKVSTAAPDPPNLVELAREANRLPSFKELSGENTFYFVPFLSNSLLDGRLAHVPWLQATPDPMSSITWQTWIEMNSKDAERMGLKEGDMVTVRSATRDTVEVLVYPHPAVPPGVVGMPVGQGHAPGVEYASRRGKQRGANPISMLALEVVEGTGALAWAATKVLVEPTGRSTKVPKFEGIVPAFPIGTREEDIVQVTSG